jgi:hypothetical protein
MTIKWTGGMTRKWAALLRNGLPVRSNARPHLRRATSHYPSNRSDGQSDRLFAFTPPLLLYQPLVIKAVPLPPYLTAIPPSSPTSFYL